MSPLLSTAQTTTVVTRSVPALQDTPLVGTYYGEAIADMFAMVAKLVKVWHSPPVPACARLCFIIW